MLRVNLPDYATGGALRGIGPPGNGPRYVMFRSSGHVSAASALSTITTKHDKTAVAAIFMADLH